MLPPAQARIQRTSTPTTSITAVFRNTARPPPARDSAGSFPQCGACRTSPCPPTPMATSGTPRATMRADEGKAPAGRTPDLPGMGSLLVPPWTLTRYAPDGVEMTGYFTRFHVGGNHAVHGGVLPLLFDHMFGMISHAAGRPISRTAFLHVDYRKIPPIDMPLLVRGRVTRTEGRKAFVSAELVDSDETVLAEGNGLMVRLLPGQP